MDGSGDYHTVWSQSVKSKYHTISHICRILKKKKKDTNKLTYKTETHSDLENKLKVSRGGRMGEWIDGEFGIDMYTLLCLK